MKKFLALALHLYIVPFSIQAMDYYDCLQVTRVNPEDSGQEDRFNFRSEDDKKILNALKNSKFYEVLRYRTRGIASAVLSVIEKDNTPHELTNVIDHDGEGLEWLFSKNNGINEMKGFVRELIKRNCTPDKKSFLKVVHYALENNRPLEKYLDIVVGYRALGDDVDTLFNSYGPGEEEEKINLLKSLHSYARAYTTFGSDESDESDETHVEKVEKFLQLCKRVQQSGSSFQKKEAEDMGLSALIDTCKCSSPDLLGKILGLVENYSYSKEDFFKRLAHKHTVCNNYISDYLKYLASFMGACLDHKQYDALKIFLLRLKGTKRDSFALAVEEGLKEGREEDLKLWLKTFSKEKINNMDLLEGLSKHWPGYDFYFFVNSLYHRIDEQKDFIGIVLTEELMTVFKALFSVRHRQGESVNENVVESKSNNQSSSVHMTKQIENKGNNILRFGRRGIDLIINACNVLNIFYTFFSKCGTKYLRPILCWTIRGYGIQK